MLAPFRPLVAVFQARIGSRILAGFGLVALLTVLVALISLGNIGLIARLLDELALPDGTLVVANREQLLLSARAQLSRTAAITMIAIVVAGLMATGAALLLTRSITRPIQVLARVASALKAGDLAVSVPSLGADEIGTLAQTMAQMATSLTASRRSLEESLADAERRHRAVSALNTVAAAAATSLDRRALLETTLDTLLGLTGVEYGGFQFPDEHGQIQLVVYRGFSETFLKAAPIDVVRQVLTTVLATGQPALMDDATVEPAELVNLMRGEGIRSAIVVPLVSPRSVVGLLTLGSRSGRRFEQDDRDLLVSIGSQIGIALEHATLLEQRQRRIMTLSIINEVGQAISAELDPDALYQVIHDQCHRFLDMPTFTIAVWDDAEDGLVPVLVYLDSEPVDASSHWRERPPVLLTLVAKERRRLLTNDYHATLRDYGVEPPEHVPPTRRSWLGVPMIIGERLTGIIVASTPNTDYTDEDGDLLQAIANQAAVAVENARLYRQTREVGMIEERNRLAREIHDTIAQGLTGLVLQLEATATLLETRPERARQRLSKATELARNTLTEARRSVWNLRPAPLEQRSLTEALAEEVGRPTDEALNVRFQTVGEPVALAPEVENGVYRILQEALQNVRRHAAATSVEVQLSWAATVVTLTIEDDGRGFETDQLSRPRSDGGGFGLLSMRERARLIGGTLRIDSSPGQGTRLTLRVPTDARGGIPAPTQPASPSASRAALP